MRVWCLTALWCACGATAHAQNARVPTAKSKVGEARVARWKDDKTAAFLLMFDDGWPSHWQVAVPELLKRDMTATFYIVPNKGEFKKFQDKEWKEVVANGMTLGNHTWSHDGFQGLEDSEKEIGDTTQFLTDFVPGKNPRLISFALPGVKSYDYGEGNTLNKMLKANNLIDRGDFKGHGAVYHWKTTEQMLALADKAIANQGMGYLVIHGVERIKPAWRYQDFWALKQDIFLPLLDGLAQRRDRGDLWITDHISQYKYDQERSGASVETLKNTPQELRLNLVTTTDPQLYDAPLTLVVGVPPNWNACQIEQNGTTTNATAKDGALMFDAMPDGKPIGITPAK